ncbi:MAG: hypothetical protein ABFR65_02895 [Pseudomonadota bacterium]
MAVGDHRYTQERWRSVLVQVLMSPHRRIELINDPYRAAETWGFCEGGLAFLRILHLVAREVGEENFQIGIDRAYEFLEENPAECLAIVDRIARIKRSLDTAGSLEIIATTLEENTGTGS